MPITDYQVGALRWMNTHPKECQQSGFYELDILMPDFETKFSDLSQLSQDVVRQLGREGHVSGTPEGFANGRDAVHGSRHPWIAKFGPVNPGWNLLSATVPSSQLDESLRYKAIVKVPLNGCGVSAALSLGIQLNAGRVVRDVTTPDYEVNTSPEARMFLLLIRSPWGTSSKAQRAEAFTTLLRALHSLNSVKFPLYGYKAFQAIVDVLFDRLPQLTWTEVIGYSCCTQQLRILPQPRIQTRTCLHLKLQRGLTLSQSINQFFQKEAVAPNKILCPRGDECTRDNCFRRRLILDASPPARFMVHLPSGSSDRLTWYKDKESSLQSFEPMKLEVWSQFSIYRKTYIVVGAVFAIDDNHFILRWRASSEAPDGSITEFNDSRTKTVAQWWAEFDQMPATTALDQAKPYYEQKSYRSLPYIVTLIYEIQTL